MNNEWIKTDDDSVQYRREAKELETGQGKVFELYQVQAVEDITKNSERDPKIYAVAHDFVYLSEVDIQSVLESYGYDSMEKLVETYGEDEADAILAECQFELDSGCLENLLSRLPLMTWEQAKETIERMIGTNDNVAVSKGQRRHKAALERAFQTLSDIVEALDILVDEHDYQKYSKILDHCAEIAEDFRDLGITEDGIISL